jgi:hypothetical protein
VQAKALAAALVVVGSISSLVLPGVAGAAGTDASFRPRPWTAQLPSPIG